MRERRAASSETLVDPVPDRCNFPSQISPFYCVSTSCGLYCCHHHRVESAPDAHHHSNTSAVTLRALHHFFLLAVDTAAFYRFYVGITGYICCGVNVAI